MSDVLKKVLSKLVSGSPKQERKLAELTLSGNLLSTIAEHMMKILLFSEHHREKIVNTTEI